MIEEEPETKRANMELPKRIGTHSGIFHCDEVLACFMLKKLPEYKDAQIVRSRNYDVLDTCDIVVDVGGVYDPSKDRYDHHQRDFSGTMKSLCPGKQFTTKLSSAGLIYLHFGHRLLAQLLCLEPNSPDVDSVYNKVYESFIEEIDGIDNGISICDEKPRYSITTNLASRVKRLNPSWAQKDLNVEEQFEIAFALVGKEFLERVNYFAKSWLPAKELVSEAIKCRHTVDESGEIIEFEDGGMPWKSHLFNLEEELQVTPPVKFVIFRDIAGLWRVQAVPVLPESFELRVPLLEAWRGLRQDELQGVSGIKGIQFVHANGFIGGHEDRLGVLRMAKDTLKQFHLTNSQTEARDCEVVSRTSEEDDDQQCKGSQVDLEPTNFMQQFVFTDHTTQRYLSVGFY